MSLTVKEGGSFQTVPAGTYPARCIRLIDIGTQEFTWNDETKKAKQIIIAWELPTELIESGEFAGQPYIVSKFFTASLHKKAGLRQALEAWRGKAFTDEELRGFNLSNILDKCCMLNIIHNEKGNAKVQGIMALPKGMIVTERINPLVSFDIDVFDMQIFDSFSDGIKNLIRKSDEYKFGNQHVDTVPYEETIPEPF